MQAAIPRRVVLSVDSARDPGDDVRLDSVRDALQSRGVDLVLASGEKATTASSGDLVARLSARPPRWWESTSMLELRDPADLACIVDALCDRDLWEPLLAASPASMGDAVAGRLGTLPAEDEALWLFGAGLVGRQAAALCRASGVHPRGFLDNDTTREGQQLDGLSIHSPKQHDVEGATIVLCTGRHQREIRTQLEPMGAARVLGLSELVSLLGNPVQPERDYGRDLWESRYLYLNLLPVLADGESRRALAGVLSHRISYLPEPLAEVRTDDQWFIAEVFRPDPTALFVDGGAFDGDTAEEFVRRNGGPGRGLELFEPDRRQCEAARRRLAGVPAVRIHNAGLSDRPGSANFLATGGMNGAVGPDGSQDIDLVTIDDAVDERVTYLKLDVEGAEQAALEGARRTILAARPVLAIAAYHHADDLWRLPAWIDALGAGYRLFLRHHTDLAFETIVYAVV